VGITALYIPEERFELRDTTFSKNRRSRNQ
jgi:hypothetical protein